MSLFILKKYLKTLKPYFMYKLYIFAYTYIAKVEDNSKRVFFFCISRNQSISISISKLPNTYIYIKKQKNK